LELADQEIRMGNLRGAEEILQEAIRNTRASAAIKRKLGMLLKSQGTKASARMPSADLSSLLQDPVFDPYRQIPALSPFLRKAAAAVSKTTPLPL
jgi:hypothetical protein